MIVTKEIENFNVTVVMPDNEIKKTDLKSLMGKNGLILFFYPKDFTFVCPTEIISFNHKLDEFTKLGYAVIGCSTDTEYSHIAWRNMKLEQGGIGQINFPLIADIKKELARKLDILFDESVALRASFLIDSNMIVRHAVINDLPLGRSTDEMLRMTEVLNHYNKYGEVCPANWNKSKKALKNNSSGISEYLSKNIDDLK